MSNEHTPGPWEADDLGRITDAQGFYIATADETAVLKDWGDRDWGNQQVLHWSDLPGVTFLERGEAEALANARLMAAAPDLYDAVAALFEEFLPALAHHYNEEDDAAFVAPLRAALAKARGEVQL